MSDTAEFVRRRKRAPRTLIPEGEFRNVTFRAGATAYNLLAEEANKEGCSISEITEHVIKKTIAGESNNTVQIDAELWKLLRTSAAASSRSVTEDVEVRLRKTFGPIGEIACDPNGRRSKASLVAQALCLVFATVSFEGDQSAYLARAGLLAAFKVILESHFLRPGGLLADIFDPEDPALQKKVEDRLAILAQQIVEAQRVVVPGLLEAQNAVLPPFDPRQSEGTAAAEADKITAPATKKKKRKI